MGLCMAGFAQICPRKGRRLRWYVFICACVFLYVCVMSPMYISICLPLIFRAYVSLACVKRDVAFDGTSLDFCGTSLDF